MIIALQRAAAVPSEITKQNLYQSIEDLGRIYIDFMGAYYGTRAVEVDNVPEIGKMTIPLDFAILQKIPLSLKLDVGASAYWSEVASMATLDNLLQLGQIDVVDYLERIPEGYISDRQQLLDKKKQQQMMAMGMQPPPAHGAATSQQAANPDAMPVPTGGAGNSGLQRALTESAEIPAG